MSESKIKGFAKGIAKATGRVAGATLRGTGTAIGGVAKGIGIVLGALANETEKLANQPKGTAKKLHDAAQSVVKNMKESKLAANAGKLKTAFHAGKLALGGVVTVMTEAIALLDSVLFDNGILNTLEKKFAEFKGDTSKFKKWLKEHDRLGAYTIYYGTICMVFAFLWEAGLADQFGKGDETLTKKSQKIIKDLKKEVEDNEIGKKIIGPWMEDKKEDTKIEPNKTDKKEEIKPTNTDKKTTVQKEPGQKLKKPDTAETKITVDKSMVIQNGHVDLVFIRKQGKTNRYALYKEIIKNPQFINTIRAILADVEGVEPETYYINDGYATQGIGMTHNYARLPGQEIEDWMFDTEERVKQKAKFAPIINIMGNIRSYNDLWQQVEMFLLDKKRNPYKTFEYMLTTQNGVIKSPTLEGFASAIAASFQDITMAEQIINRLVDKQSPTGLTTDSKKIDYAFSTKRGKAQERRNDIEKEAYKGNVGITPFIVGKDHSSKKQSFTNSKEFLKANVKGNGDDFNITFGRNSITAERAALFKMFYHIMEPDNPHFNITKDDIELITALKGHFGQKWKDDFNQRKARTKNSLRLADYNIQEKILFYILNNPKEVADNPAVIRTMLKNWHKKKDTSQFENVDHSTMLAMANNMRGLGM